MKKIIIVGMFCIGSFNVSAAPTMYVPSGNSNDVMIIDLSTDKIIGRIGELENPHGLAGSPNTEYLVAGSMKPMSQESEGAVKPRDMSDKEHDSHHSGSSRNNKNNTSSFVSIVHPQHGHVMRRIAVNGLTHHTIVSPDGKHAIAVHPGVGGVSVINLDEMKVVKEVQTGKWPNYAVFTPNGKRLYVSNAEPGTVSEIDTSDWSVIQQISVGKKPEHMSMAKDGKKLYVANVDDATAAVINLEKSEVDKRYSVGKKPHGIDVSVDGRWLFVSSKSGNKLHRIDLIEDEIVSVDLTPAPYHLEYVDKLKKLYVASRKSPKIWVINPSTLKIENEIDIKQGVAHQMVVMD